MKRHGALTLDDLFEIFIILVVYFGALYQPINNLINDALPNLNGMQSLVASLIPLVILLGLLRTIVAKSRTPVVYYQDQYQ